VACFAVNVPDVHSVELKVRLDVPLSEPYKSLSMVMGLFLYFQYVTDGDENVNVVKPPVRDFDVMVAENESKLEGAQASNSWYPYKVVGLVVSPVVRPVKMRRVAAAGPEEVPTNPVEAMLPSFAMHENSEFPAESPLGLGVYLSRGMPHCVDDWIVELSIVDE